APRPRRRQPGRGRSFHRRSPRSPFRSGRCRTGPPACPARSAFPAAASRSIREWARCCRGRTRRSRAARPPAGPVERAPPPGPPSRPPSTALSAAWPPPGNRPRRRRRRAPRGGTATVRKQRALASLGESRSMAPEGSISPECAAARRRLRFFGMRRARFYILILGLTLLPQVVAASDLVRWLAAQGQLALGLSVPGVLLALNLPMLAEVLRRKKSARLPRFLAATVQTPWTAFWL